MRFFSKPDSKNEDPAISFLKSDSPPGTVFDAKGGNVVELKREHKDALAPRVKDINAYTSSILEKEMEKDDKKNKQTVRIQRRPLMQIITSALGKI